MFAKLIAHKRFTLFAPFIGLAALTLVAFVFWHVAADRMAARLQADGLSWQALNKQGFPARITLALRAPRWRRGDMVWQNDGMSLTTMPFNGGHAIVDFLGTHEFQNRYGRMQLAHSGNLMSLVTQTGGLARASFEAQVPVISGLWQNRTINAKADMLGLHTRRTETSDDARRHDVALVVKNLRFENAPQDGLARFDMAGSVPTGFLTAGPAAGQVFILDRLTTTRDGVTVIARGRVKLRADGRMDGGLDLDIVNLRGFIDELIEARIIAPRDRQKFLLLGGLGAALGGDTQDRLSLPLNFTAGRIRLGPLDLGAAPHWQ